MDTPTTHAARPAEPAGRPVPATVAALDIGGTKIAGALVHFDGSTGLPQVTARRSIPTDAVEGGSAVLTRVVALACELCAKAEAAGVGLAGVGVGTAGRVDATTGTIAYANSIMPGWTGQPVAEGLHAATGLPVAVLGDVQAHALGEARWGAARGADTCLMVAPGTGLGGAVVAHGRVLRGAHGFAGEIGATPNPLAPSHAAGEAFARQCADLGLPADGGVLESVAAGSGIEARYEALGGAVASGAEIARRAGEGEPLACRVLGEAGYALGMALAGWANMLDPEIVVLAGSVTKAGPVWEDALRRGFAEHAPSVLADLPLVGAALGADAPLVGAAEHLLDTLQDR